MVVPHRFLAHCLSNSSLPLFTSAGDAVPGPLGFFAWGRQQAHRTGDALRTTRRPVTGPAAALGLPPGRALSSTAAVAEYFGPPLPASAIRQSPHKARPTFGDAFRPPCRTDVLRGTHKLSTQSGRTLPRDAVALRFAVHPPLHEPVAGSKRQIPGAWGRRPQEL